MLTWLDYAIIGIILISVLIGIVRGFVREALSLASWVLAFWVGFTYTTPMAAFLTRYIETPGLRIGVAFAVLFLGTLLIAGAIGFLIAHLVEKVGLSTTDRALGTVFGFGRGALFVAVLLVVGTLISLNQYPWWEQSKLLPLFEPVVAWLEGFLPTGIATNVG